MVVVFIVHLISPIMALFRSVDQKAAIVLSTHEHEQDRLWVERVQAGDMSAFDELILRYRDRLFGIVYNMTGNREDTADILQESFIKAFQSIARFRASACFFTWIYRIVLNTTLSFFRRRKLRSFFSFEAIDEEAVCPEVLAALADKRPSAQRTVLLEELQEKLNEALLHLPLKHRTTLILSEIDGLSCAQIADIMDCHEGTVRSRLHYAKKMLQPLLNPYLQ